MILDLLAILPTLHTRKVLIGKYRIFRQNRAHNQWRPLSRGIRSIISRHFAGDGFQFNALTDGWLATSWQLANSLLLTISIVYVFLVTLACFKHPAHAPCIFRKTIIQLFRDNVGCYLRTTGGINCGCSFQSAGLTFNVFILEPPRQSVLF